MNLMTPYIRLLKYPASTLLVSIVMLSGCASLPAGPDPDGDRRALQRALAGQDCAAAQEAVDGLARHDSPGDGVARARLETAFLCLVSDMPDSAYEQSRRFIQAFPAHPDLDYGFYLRAMARYGSWKALHAEGEMPPEPRQDIALARESFILFRELVQRFPDSRYRDEVAAYLMALREGMAAAEIRQARSQLAQGNPRQALARAEYVREHFGGTQALAGALAVMVEAHEALGQSDAAGRARRQLEIRFPDSLTP
ncbi:outer membrane protein assembly factor BamD [Ectothiorhodospira shaposhnikovii]|uniref:outer membrane protein assembly factor BamD n=1 Tax=Ectothiorhodospira shaposhnikovii TaxID=1054 RepID=UPI0030B83570